MNSEYMLEIMVAIPSEVEPVSVLERNRIQIRPSKKAKILLFKPDFNEVQIQNRPFLKYGTS